MARFTKITIHYALMVSLTLSFVLSSSSHSLSHDPLVLAAISAQHEAEKVEHGHSHEEPISPVHIFHGHVHDVADHDHNGAFLFPPKASNRPTVSNSRWLIAATYTWRGPAFDLDRPPRG
jgi:hypothetical protein